MYFSHIPSVHFLPFLSPSPFPLFSYSQIWLRDLEALSAAFTERTTYAATRHVLWALNRPKMCLWPISVRKRIFTALHVMQTRYCDENSVCPSVCPSVCLSVRLSVTRVYCDKTVERSVQIDMPYERWFSLVFWEEEWLVGGDPFYLKFWVSRPPLERNRRFSTNNRS